MNGKDLATFLTEKITERGWTLRKVSDVTGISPAHLEHLIRGEFDELPAAPYLRGYLVKLGDALEFDPEPWWRAIQRGVSGTVMPRSGVDDTLPVNRFSRTKAGKWAWLGVVVLALVVYGAVRFSAIFGLPTLAVVFPDADTLSTTSQMVTLRGTLTNGTDIKVNGEPIPLADDSSWQKEVTLSEGLNTFEFTAEKFLGRSRTVVRQIVYAPVATSTPDGTGTTTSPTLPEEPGTNTESTGTTTSSRTPNPTTIIF